MLIVKVKGPGIIGTPFGGTTDMHQIEGEDRVAVEEDGTLVVRPVDLEPHTGGPDGRSRRSAHRNRVVRYARGVWSSYEVYEQEATS